MEPLPKHMQIQQSQLDSIAIDVQLGDLGQAWWEQQEEKGWKWQEYGVLRYEILKQQFQGKKDKQRKRNGI